MASGLPPHPSTRDTAAQKPLCPSASGSTRSLRPPPPAAETLPVTEAQVGPTPPCQNTSPESQGGGRWARGLGCYSAHKEGEGPSDRVGVARRRGGDEEGCGWGMEEGWGRGEGGAWRQGGDEEGRVWRRGGDAEGGAWGRGEDEEGGASRCRSLEGRGQSNRCSFLTCVFFLQFTVGFGLQTKVKLVFPTKST